MFYFKDDEIGKFQYSANLILSTILVHIQLRLLGIKVLFSSYFTGAGAALGVSPLINFNILEVNQLHHLLKKNLRVLPLYFIQKCQKIRFYTVNSKIEEVYDNSGIVV